MLGGISIFLRIPRSVNKPGSNAKLEGSSHLVERPKKPTIVEGERAGCFSRSDGPAWLDLAAFSASTFSSSPISKILRIIVRKSFSHYIFFWTWSRITQKDPCIYFSKASSNSTSSRAYVEDNILNWATVGLIISYLDRFDRIHSTQRDESNGDTV